MERNGDISRGFVVADLVTQPEHWKHSSAVDYAGGKGLVEVSLLY